MSERDHSYHRSSKQQQSSQAGLGQTGPKSCPVTFGAATLLSLAYCLPFLTGREALWRWLSLRWDSSVYGFKLWQFLTYPLVVGPEPFRTKIHIGLFVMECIIPVLVVGICGLEIERRIGSRRMLVSMLALIVVSGLLGLMLIRACPHLGLSVGGGTALALGLVTFLMFLIEDENLYGVFPGPFVFLMSATLLIALATLFALSHSNQSSVPFRSELSALPAVFIGASLLSFDDIMKRGWQRYKDQREVALVIEEVNARAEVEVLLERIAQFGMGSLTKAERAFLKKASRFYKKAD